MVLNLIEGTTHHHPDFKFRANIFLDEIHKGDFSLVIKDIKMTDEGNYECFNGNSSGNILSSVYVKVRVKKGNYAYSEHQMNTQFVVRCCFDDIYLFSYTGIHHGHRERVLHYTGDSFTFFVSIDGAEVYHISEEIDHKKLICKMWDMGATCQKDILERVAVHQGYLTLKDLTENDEGTYTVVQMDETLAEIVLEVRQLPSNSKFVCFSGKVSVQTSYKNS